jgi:hypothetical protein
MCQSIQFKFKVEDLVKPKNAGERDLHHDVAFGAIWALYTTWDVPAYEVTWQYRNGEKFDELTYEEELDSFNEES